MDLVVARTWLFCVDLPVWDAKHVVIDELVFGDLCVLVPRTGVEMSYFILDNTFVQFLGEFWVLVEVQQDSLDILAEDVTGIRLVDLVEGLQEALLDHNSVSHLVDRNGPRLLQEKKT